jgi:hypothetical protein
VKFALEFEDGTSLPASIPKPAKVETNNDDDFFGSKPNKILPKKSGNEDDFLGIKINNSTSNKKNDEDDIFVKKPKKTIDDDDDFLGIKKKN